MKTLLRVICVTALLSQLIPVANAHEGSHQVEIRNQAFNPKVLTIDADEEVTWIAREDNHNVKSQTGAWDPSPTLRPGQSFSVPFPTEGTYEYWCSIHGFTGTIKVGDGCDGDCPVRDPDASAEIRVVPSLDFGSLADAIKDVPADSRIELRPGEYRVDKTVELPAPGVVLRGTKEDGTPADPGSVVLRGVRGAEVGIRFGPASAVPAPTAVREQNTAAVENVTLTRFLDSAIVADGTRGFRVSNVVAHTNVEYGIRAVGSTNGTIVDSELSGHRRAGLSIEECDRCDIHVRRVSSHDNFVGIQGRNAGSLVVRDSTIDSNAAGIVLRSVATEETRLQRGNHFYRNTVTDNDNPDAPRPSVLAFDEAMELGSGAGIWVQGGWDNLIESNTVTGNHYGIAVTGSTVPVKDSQVRSNTLSDNTVDLGWDGLGIGVCFDKNAAATSAPAEIQTLYGCSRAAKVGVPYPKVTVDLAVHAWRAYYCAELGACS